MIFGSSRVAPEKVVFRPTLAMSLLPGISEMQMTTLTYSEQLRHPNWQRRRLEIMQRDNFCCSSCSDKEITLNVHHRRYVKGRMPWEYTDAELVTLCRPCHEAYHENNDALKDVIWQLPIDGPSNLHDAMGLLAGWANGEQLTDFSAHMQIEPFYFVVGEIANRLGATCNIEHLMSLLAALNLRDKYTTREAIDQFVVDLKTRVDALPPALEPGWEI